VLVVGYWWEWWGGGVVGIIPTIFYSRPLVTDAV